MSDPITIIVDWDYDNFTVDESGHYHLWNDPVSSEGPEFVYVMGWPGCGHDLPKTLMRRVGPFEYSPERN